MHGALPLLLAVAAGGMDITTLEPVKNVPAGYAKEHSDPRYYRFNVQGMASMRTLMDAAGVLSSEAAPKFPDAPKAADAKQQELYSAVLQGGDGAKAARKKLSAGQLKTLDGYIAAVRKTQGTPSAASGKVPGFK